MYVVVPDLGWLYIYIYICIRDGRCIDRSVSVCMCMWLCIGVYVSVCLCVWLCLADSACFGLDMYPVHSVWLYMYRAVSVSACMSLSVYVEGDLSMTRCVRA